MTSPDAPVGVGAVGKLCLIQGRPTMKKSRGSGKATLPGRVQVFRDGWKDRVVPWGETAAGRPLLQPVWEGASMLDLPSKEEARGYAKDQIAQLPEEQKREIPRELEISDGLLATIAALCS